VLILGRKLIHANEHERARSVLRPGAGPNNRRLPIRGYLYGGKRMSQSHPIEVAWRQFAANQGRMRMFRECFRRIPATLENLRAHGGITAWPPGIVLSMAVPATMAMTAQTRLYPNEPRGPVIPLFREYSNTMHVWAAYRESKTIYQVEPYLIECLSRTPWPDGVPAEAIRLTSYCPILEFQ